MSSQLHAFSQYCQSNIKQHQAALAYASIKKSELATGAGAQLRMIRDEASFSWRDTYSPAHSSSFGFNAVYTIMDFSRITPMTNGHLHTWSMPVTGKLKTKQSDVFYQVSPALSVSSNVLKNPGLINRDSLQLNTALIYKQDLHRKYNWVIGFISDHRFGDYYLYPVGGLCLQPSKDWLLQLALPDFNIRKTFSNGINLSFYLSPEGNQWHVFSKDRQRDSDFSYNAIITGLSAQWFVTSTFGISLDINKHMRRELRAVLDDNSLLTTDVDSNIELSVRGDILF